MKKNIFLVLFVAITLSGCNLEEVLLDSPSTDNFINTESDIALSISGTYGYLNSGSGFKTEGFNMLQLTAEDVSSVSINNAAYAQKIMDSGFGNLSNIYRTFYSIINNCNFLLYKTESLNIDSTFKVGAKAEVKFLRAYAYFNMVRWFGPLPIRTVHTDINSTFNIPRSPIDSVYKLIFSDLKEASACLKPKSVSAPYGLGYANKGAAQAMLAKAYLTYGNMLDLNGRNTDAIPNYALAKLYADSVIQSNEYVLLTNYADLWNVDNEKEAYREVIFSILFSRDRGSQSVQSKGSEFAYRFQPITRADVSGNTKPKPTLYSPDRNGSADIRVQPWFYDRCSTGDYVDDYRTEVTFLTSWTNRFNPNKLYVAYPSTSTASNLYSREPQPYINKYTDMFGIDNRNHENDLFIIRYSEIFLIKAEAENEINGPTAEAYTAFNELRKRARKANGVLRTTPADLQTGLTKDDFRMKIFNERGLEFVGEGQRWFDLVRMKSPNGYSMYKYQYQDFLPTLTPGLPTWNNLLKKWVGGKTEASNVVPYNVRYELFPIPQREIDINSLLKPNNPGWE